ncbi:MAG: protein kinase [Verrucomicrobiae bacterium]|nr:protein kinase [Verrucomicrobiae bacterium]
MMQSGPECPKCGGEIPPNTPPGFCPGCALLDFGLSSADGVDEDEEILPGELHTGELVGRYAIVRALGAGGAGDVYLAEQAGEVTVRVAIKVLRASALSDRLVARFEAERDATMRMDHPGIAKVLDAGFLSDGRPFVAMEYVAGDPLNTFFEKRCLPVRDQLELFIRICAAVQHAHVKGVLHRDLKPTNILVTQVDQEYVPKLIDFGISRSLDRSSELDALFTQQAEILGTPAYMSPEQTRGGNADIDVRSDVYALGVLLYELLTGAPPLLPETLAKMSIDETLTEIRETDAARPSSRKPGIDTDLDAVTLKALAKEPERRYQSTGALAEDIERFLNSEPVTATPPTASYRLRKFVRRNRTSVAAAGAVLTAILLGSAVSLYQAHQARQSRDAATASEKLATDRLAASEDLIQFMVVDLYNQLKPIGKLATLSDTAEEVEAFYNALGAEDRSIESRVRQAKAYMYLGRVRSAQGNAEQATTNFESGIHLLEDTLRDSPDDESVVDSLSNLWDSLGAHYLRQGENEAAISAFAKASDMVAGQLEKYPDSHKWRNIAIGQLINTGAMAAEGRDWRESLTHLSRARDLENAETPVEQLILIEQNACRAFTHLGLLDEAEGAASKAIELNAIQLKEKPEDTDVLMRQADLITNLSAVQYNRKDYHAVVDSNLKTAAIQEKLLTIEPANVYWQERQAETYRRLSLGYAGTSLPDKKEKQLEAARKAFKVREPLALSEQASDAAIQGYLSDIDYFESAASQLGLWQESFQLRVKTYALRANQAEADLKIGRAAALHCLELANRGDLKAAEDYRQLAIWVLSKHPTPRAELSKDNWPIGKVKLSSTLDTARLAETIQSGRIIVPESWKSELLETGAQ